MLNMNRMTIKRLLCAALSIGALVLMLVQTARLDRCDGLLVVQWQSGVHSAKVFEAQLQGNSLVRSLATFKRYESTARTDLSRSVSCAVYATGASFAQTAALPMASGRFFLPTDYVEENLIVLGHDTATALFSGKDCLGARVLVDGAAYTVLGVAAENPVGIEQFARVEGAAVYILDIGNGAAANTTASSAADANAATYTYVRTFTAAADLLEHTLSASANGAEAVYNLAQDAGLTRMVCHLFVMLWLAVAGFHLAKAVSGRFAAQNSDRRRILFWSVWAASIVLAVLVGVVAFNFRLVIPSGWFDGAGGFAGYFIRRNANPVPALYLAQVSGYALVQGIVLGVFAMSMLGSAARAGE